MKRIMFVKLLIVGSIFFMFSCEKEDDPVKDSLDYSGNWQRTVYTWTGSYSIDTAVFEHSLDSVKVLHGDSVTEIAFVTADTLKIIHSDNYSIGFDYLVRKSDNYLSSNSPITRLVDSIVFKRID